MKKFIPRILRTTCHLWLVAFTLPVFSQVNSERDSSALEEVIVTALRKETRAFLMPYSVKSISHTQLSELNARTTPESLVTMNGVFVQKTNHGGGSPFVRGLTGNQVLILVDGIRMNNSTFRYGPNQYLNTVDVFTINKIEVAKGTGSVQYGTDALGGVVHVLTNEPVFSPGKKIWEGKVVGRFVSGGMDKTGRGELVFRDKKIAIMGGITYRHFGDVIGGDTTGRQFPSGYKELAMDMKAKILLSSNWQLSIAHQSVTQQDVPVYHKLKLENFAINEMEPQQRVLNYAKLGGKTLNRFIHQVEMIASWQRSEEGRNSRKNNSNTLRREKDQVNTLGFTSDVLSEITKAWSANSGIELYFDKVGSTRRDIDQVSGSTKDWRGLYPNDSKYSSYSLYTLHHFSFNKIIVDLGGRFNFFDIRITDTTLGKLQLNPSAIVFNAAILYQAGRNQAVYTSLSSGYRAPNVDDLGTLGIVDFRYELPTKELEPEKSVHAEGGYKFNTKNFNGSINLFYLWLRNIITRVKSDGEFISGYQVYRKENTDKAFIKGLETELNWSISKHVKLSSALAYAYGQNPVNNEPMRRVPPLNGRTIITYRESRWFTAIEYLYASKQDRLSQGDKDDNRIPAGGTPGWNVLNLYCGYKLSQLTINGGLQNLFDQDYRTHGSGINAPGRSGWLSLMIQL